MPADLDLLKQVSTPEKQPAGPAALQVSLRQLESATVDHMPAACP